MVMQAISRVLIPSAFGKSTTKPVKRSIPKQCEVSLDFVLSNTRYIDLAIFNAIKMRKYKFLGNINMIRHVSFLLILYRHDDVIKPVLKYNFIV